MVIGVGGRVHRNKTKQLWGCIDGYQGRNGNRMG